MYIFFCYVFICPFYVFVFTRTIGFLYDIFPWESGIYLGMLNNVIFLLSSLVLLIVFFFIADGIRLNILILGFLISIVLFLYLYIYRPLVTGTDLLLVYSYITSNIYLMINFFIVIFFPILLSQFFNKIIRKK